MTNHTKQFFNTGFTLIELLVVISIISVLSSIAITSLGSARSKAQATRAKQEILQVAKAVELARITRGGQPPLFSITGSTCSHCATNRATQLQAAFGAIAAAGGNVYAGLSSIVYDPSGQAYIFDENENEQGPTACNRDYMSTSGITPPIRYLFEYVSTYCKQNPIGVAGFQ